MPTFESKTGKLAPQSILIRRYLILNVAGRGGMSAIYQALDTQGNQRRVAIKEMSQENLDDEERQEAMARFEQEARLLGTLHHPNLPRIYDAFGAGGRSFLVMDYIDGKNLLQLLHDAGQPLAVDQTLHYADQLCDVLTYLHGQQPPIIFRDLKPTNVMATREGHVYLIDFGIARFFKEGQPQDTVVLGSPGYAPPEQHGSGQTTPRSDLYALGATLHCCLTNRDPYNSTERFSFASVRQLNPQVPEALDTLIMRMLALDERQRPTSALEVKQALAHIRQQMRNQNSSARIPAATASSSTPTQYMQSPQPAYQPTQLTMGQGAPQERLILRASPIPGTPGPGPFPPAPDQTVSAYRPYPPAPANRQTRERTRVWSVGFLLLFFFLLIMTVGGSFLAFNISYPYGPTNNAGLDHATEAGLTVLALLVSFTMIVMTRSIIAVLIVLLGVAAMLAAGSAFLLQTLRDLQPSVQILAQFRFSQVNQLFSYALLGAGLISFLWLFRRPFAWSDRCWLLLFSAAICACTYLQMQYADNDQNKHFLLLGALIVFIQTLLMAGQMERRRK